MPEKWPRLSLQLKHVRDPLVCQSCGQRELPGGDGLQRWREHDDKDRPENVLVILCAACAKRLIEPHERLYDQVDRLAPWPGAMPICVDCKHRAGMHCTHRDLKSNGGPGLKLSFPKPDVMHISCRPRSKSGWHTIYRGPVSDCAGRELIEAKEQAHA